MNAPSPLPETSPPTERDAIDGILCDAVSDAIGRHRVATRDTWLDDVDPLAAQLRADLRRSNIELINVVAPGARRSDTVLLTVHTLALAQRNWAMTLLERQAPEGVAFVAHLTQRHDARVAELLNANNAEVERRRAAEDRAIELEARLASHDDAAGDMRSEMDALQSHIAHLERTAAAAAQFGHLASGLRKLLPDIGDQITTALAALDGERSKLVDDFIAALRETT